VPRRVGPKGMRIVIEPGDSPIMIAQTLVGEPQRWRELVAANPDKRRSTSGNFQTLIPGETLCLPLSWIEKADRARASGLPRKLPELAPDVGGFDDVSGLMSDGFWYKLTDVANIIGARRPEDLLMVLSAESAFTLNPAAANWSRRPKDRPPVDWSEAQGYVGLNTIGPEAARELGLTPQEWWNIGNLSAEDNLYYTQKFFLHTLQKYGKGKKGFANTLDLYLANAALGTWIRGVDHQLTPQTIIYNEAQTRSNPGLDWNKDGVVDVQDMNDALIGAVFPNTKKFLAEYAAFRSVAGLATKSPYTPVSFTEVTQPKAATPYKPDSTKDAIDAINGGKTPTPAQGKPSGTGPLVALLLIVGAIFVGRRYL